jgi:hypothetical protein
MKSLSLLLAIDYSQDGVYFFFCEARIINRIEKIIGHIIDKIIPKYNIPSFPA